MQTAVSARVELLEAALKAFAEEGFETTTMARIAERAGVPLETAFLHFPSKHAFALATYQTLAAEAQARIADLPHGTVAKRFDSLMRQKLELCDAQRSTMRALIAASVDSKGPLGVLGGGTALIRARMAGTFHAVVLGASDAPDDVEALSALLYGIHLGLVLLWTQDDDGRIARAALVFVCEVLEAVGPLIGMPIVSDRLARLETVFGDRLSPVTSADVERRARWLLGRLMQHRRLLHERADGPPTEEELAPHLPLVRAALTEGRPLELLLPAFPAKSPNPTKVLGCLPDMGERVALRSLQTLCEELGEASPAGVNLLICSDGLVFADIVGVTDEEVLAYGVEIDRLLGELPLLRRFDLDHAFGTSTPIEARSRLLASWGEDESTLQDRVKASPALAAQLDGLHRFMFEDGAALAPEVSRTQLRKRARGQALQVLLRSRAWGKLLSSCFPQALRLSIHPQAAVSDKLGIHLLPTNDAWLTPWHGVALLENDRFQLVKRKDAEALGARRVDAAGRGSHYVLSA